MAEEKKSKAKEIIEKIKEFEKNAERRKVIIEKMERPEPWPDPPADEEKK